MSESVPAGNAQARSLLQKTFKSGNFKDAYEGFSKLALDPKDDPRQVGDDLKQAAQCLQRLNRLDELDEFREKVIEIHKNNWRLLWAAAQNYMSYDHHGFIVAGKFNRGNKRGGGNMVNAQERDRMRALQLMVQALPPARQDDARNEVGNFLLSLGEMFLNNRGYSESWRLQYLSDLKTLPDYDPGWGYYREPSGAPVGEDGKPIYHTIPKSFEAAETDGERWRWCLEQAKEVDPNLMGAVSIRFADFLHQQFGVQTMAHYGWNFGRVATDDSKEDESGTFALHTLGENETIARLATGIKRFELPDEFNYIKIYRQIADEPKSGYRNGALEHLAQIFENRRQYPQAAAYWRRLLKEHSDQGPGKTQAVAAANRPDREELGPLRAVFDPARRQGGVGRVPVPQRQSRRFHRAGNQGRKASRRREGLHQFAAEANGMAEIRRFQHRLQAHRTKPEAVSGPRNRPVEHGT